MPKYHRRRAHRSLDISRADICGVLLSLDNYRGVFSAISHTLRSGKEILDFNEMFSSMRSLEQQVLQKPYIKRKSNHKKKLTG